MKRYAMKNLVLFLVCCFTVNSFSQDDEIIGSYYMSSGNPEGGTTLIIMPNNSFVVAYFGGLRKGTWELNDDTYQFNYHTEPKVVLYGRQNPNLMDSIAVSMSLDSDGDFAVRFKIEGNVPFQPIFNQNANCLSHPYIYQQKGALHNLEIYTPDLRDTYEETKENLSEIYSFKNTEAYNEFILSGLSEEYSEAGFFQATYATGILTLNDGEDRIEKSENYDAIDEETLAFITQHTEMEIFPERLEFGHEIFPYYENPTPKDLKPYTRITAHFLTPKNIEILKNSLFTANCEDRD